MGEGEVALLLKSIVSLTLLLHILCLWRGHDDGSDDALKSIEWLEESDSAPQRRRRRGESVINGMFAHSEQNTRDTGKGASMNDTGEKLIW